MILPEIADPPRHFRRMVLLADRDWLTENQRYGWRAKSRRVKQWRTIGMAHGFSLPTMTGAYVVAEFRFSDGRRRDPLNWAPTVKAIIDGLVDAKVFGDDNSKVITGPDLRMGPVVAKQDRGVVLHFWPTGVPGWQGDR